MLDGNTWAEINRDNQTDEMEQAQLQQDQIIYSMCLGMLLDGKTVKFNGKSANMTERMADQYQEFADFVDMDYDFMADFLSGSLDPVLSNLIRAEAKTLASVIVG